MLGLTQKPSSKSRKPKQNLQSTLKSKSSTSNNKSILNPKLSTIFKPNTITNLSKKPLIESTIENKEHKQVKSLVTTSSFNRKVKKHNLSPPNLNKQNIAINSSQKKSTESKKAINQNKKQSQVKTNAYSCVNSGNLISTPFPIKKSPHKIQIVSSSTGGANKKIIGEIKRIANSSSITKKGTQNNIKQDSKTKQIITTTNSIENINHPSSNKNKHSKQNDYAKLFGIINNEIKEISDLFKRTQSVDQQKKNESDKNVKFPRMQTDYEIDSEIFEKELSEEANGEKMIDISQLDDFQWKITNNYNASKSILFSSYNSDLYKNLVNSIITNNQEKNNIANNENNNDEEYLGYYNTYSSSSSRNNMVKIAQNNINELCEMKKMNVQKQKDNDKSTGSGKTECQFEGVAFNNGESKQRVNDLEKTEKTYNLNENEDYKGNDIPIQEVM